MNGLNSRNFKKLLNRKYCVMCGSKQNIIADHIIPLCLGGDDNEVNLQPLCENCHKTKKTPIDNSIIAFFKKIGFIIKVRNGEYEIFISINELQKCYILLYSIYSKKENFYEK